MRQRAPCMSAVAAAKDSGGCVSINHLCLCRRDAKEAIGGPVVDEGKGFAAICRDVDARIAGGINGAVRSSGGKTENTAGDAFDDFPVKTSIGTACHAIATVSQQLAGDTRDSKQSRDAPKWECPCRG